jgi:dihydrodipicolinate synthase/N-acetylneuraminate lyase
LATPLQWPNLEVFDMLDLERLHGIIPPILTPVTEGGSIDLASLRRLIEFQIGEGVHGIWVLGTTGEFASFTRRERAEAIEAAVDQARGRVPVVANISDAGTRLAIENARDAAAAGADAIALLPPYYYVNEQDELLEHFRALRAAVDLPLLAYNIPQNVKAKFGVETILKLGAEGAIVGLKDSQNDLDWFRQVMTGARERGIALRGFLGTRYLIDAGLLAGAHGAIRRRGDGQADQGHQAGRPREGWVGNGRELRDDESGTEADGRAVDRARYGAATEPDGRRRGERRGDGGIARAPGPPARLSTLTPTPHGKWTRSRTEVELVGARPSSSSRHRAAQARASIPETPPSSRAYG